MLQCELVGTCNKCGRCCEVEIDGRRFYCDNLIISNIVGLPYATSCRVYKTRRDGMPISLTDRSGSRLSIHGKCASNSPQETTDILARGIGRGCSLKPVYKEVPA